MPEECIVLFQIVWGFLASLPLKGWPILKLIGAMSWQSYMNYWQLNRT